MGKTQEYSVIYTIGAFGYSVLEILWRGFTHWSMAVTGGLCFLCLYLLDAKKPAWALWKKSLLGSVIITSIEFIVGCLVNKVLHLGIWDYSQRFFNIMGQICPLYTILWFLLCIPLFHLTKYLQKRIAAKSSNSTGNARSPIDKGIEKTA